MSATTMTYQLEKVKVPRWAINMAMKCVRTNKLFSVYFALKAIFPNGEIVDLKGKASKISGLLCMHPKTFFARVEELTEKGILTHDKSTNKYSIISNKKFAEIYGFFNREQYHFIKLKAKLKFEYVVRATYLKIQYAEQHVAIIKRLKRTQQVDTQEAERLVGKFISSRENAFRDNTVREYYYNTDCAISQAKIAELFGNESQSSGNYWTRRLEKLKLLAAQARKVFSPNYCRNTDFGYWTYAPGGKGTVLILPNKLHFSI